MGQEWQKPLELRPQHPQQLRGLCRCTELTLWCETSDVGALATATEITSLPSRYSAQERKRCSLVRRYPLVNPDAISMEPRIGGTIHRRDGQSSVEMTLRSAG